MSDKIFDFDEQKKIGDVGESTFLTFYKSLNPKLSRDFKIDFVLQNGWFAGKTVELKTDSYDMDQTQNFFMERWTVSGTKISPGGPWRAKEHGIDFFVYFFSSNGAFFWFDPVTLVPKLDELIDKNNLSGVKIPNQDRKGNYYEARGYKINRAWLPSPILLRLDWQ